MRQLKKFGREIWYYFVARINIKEKKYEILGYNMAASYSRFIDHDYQMEYIIIVTLSSGINYSVLT